MKVLATLLTLIVSTVLSGCDTGPTSARGFRLPDGDADRGRAVFVQLECHACHTVQDVDLPEPTQKGSVLVTLGGPVSQVKTYGELVSSVINPSHRIAPRLAREEVTEEGESRMRVYNDVLTVQQLIDVVAFLQSSYDVVIPAYSYQAYRYP